jgi:gliding motility-associated protein GldM
MTVQKLTNEMVAYIQNVKWENISKENRCSMEEAKTTPLGEIKARDKYDESTSYYFNGSEDGAAGKSGELRKKIDEYRTKILALIDDPKMRTTLDSTIGLKTGKGEKIFKDANGSSQNFEQHFFYHTILAANVVILNKIINEVKNVEFDVLALLYSSISEKDFKFDKIDVAVVPKSLFVTSGQEFEADVFVAALNTKDAPEIYYGADADTINKKIIGQQTAVPASGGVGKLKIAAGGSGPKTYGVVINVKDPTTGINVPYAVKGEYYVIPPAVTISPTKMNVFYIGVDNPVSIGVPGVPSEKVRASISGAGGSIVKSGKTGEYTVKVSSIGEANVTVSADVNGSSRSMGSMKFRCKRIPDPIGYVAGVKSGPISKSALLANPIVVAKLEGFDFEANYIVTSFTLSYKFQGDFISESSAGSRFSSNQINAINKCGKGSKVYIEDIKAKGPDGTIRTLPAVNLKIVN